MKNTIEKYLKSFPYINDFLGEDDITLFFQKIESGKGVLRMLDLERSDELEDAIVACDLDFNKRNFWPRKFFPERNELLYFGDDDNKERINAYVIDLNSRTSRKITDSPYVALFGISPDRKTMVYSDRFNVKDGMYQHKLYIRSFPDGKDREIYCDIDQDYKITWGRVAFSHDQKKIYFGVDYQNQRQRMNFLELDLESGATKLLLPKDQECSFPYFKGDGFERGFFYISDIDGFENIYHLDFKTNEISQHTFLSEENYGIGLSKNEKQFIVLEYDLKKDITTFSLFDIDKNKIKLSKKLNRKSKYSLNSFYESIWVYKNNLSIPNQIIELNSNLEEIRTINMFLGEVDQLSHNTYEYIEYESFDGKKVPSFITLPKGEIKGAVITSFYGGSNAYGSRNQLYSELGLVHLSPGVRGSSQFGKEWREHIQGDLGGKEIVDLTWGARYLEERFGLDSSKIGVQGGSHGGYAVLRALTLPQNYNDIENARYEWGFGLCWCGFASLEHFYETSNIPDWLVYMLGPIEENRDRYIDRSPVTHVDKLSSKVFISHGENDSRVDIGSINDFINRCDEEKKSTLLTTHIVSGAGHSYNKYEDKYRDHELLVNFLNSILK
ncbi:prolyl oligopeptidase family serine peptidase [Bacteriovoracaceae bacterium]|nr:prolyl oligopeptidase family serine peptidase [Bacteriovoracaceae bacterium]